MTDVMIATPVGDPADATLLLTFLSKVSGTRYHEPSARDAHRRIAAFFHRHLAS